MRRFLFLVSTLILVSCGHRVMTMQAFYEIPTGISEAELKQLAGTPAAVHRRGDAIEYEYVERFKNGVRTILERHYYFVIRDDQVVSRRVEQVNPSPYSINSYDLQTSCSEEESLQSDDSD